HRLRGGLHGDRDLRLERLAPERYSRRGARASVLVAGGAGGVDGARDVLARQAARAQGGSRAMPLTPHVEHHFTASAVVRDIEIAEKAEVEAEEVMELLQSHGLTAEESAPVVEALRRRPEAWRDFMMRFELGLEKPDPARARTSALVIGGAYVAGGLIPLTPYMLVASARSALPWSALVTLTALAVFGWVKGNFAGTTPLRSALQTVLIGGLAAGAAFLIARLIA